MKILKRVLIGIFLVIASMMAFVSISMIRDGSIDYKVDLGTTTIPTYKASELPFQHKFHPKKSLPVTAGAVFDFDGKGAEEVFLGGGYGQPDAIFRYENGVFVDITKSTGWKKSVKDATLSAISLDVDKDGDNDLIITRTNGVWLYTNDNCRAFTAKRLNIEMDKETTPLSVAVVDLNRDGHFDLYVSGYIDVEKMEGQNIFNKKGYGGLSRMYLNKGDNTFKDITKESGLWYKHNTFQGVFIDVDKDGLEDLVVVHDTGQVRTWKNKGNLKFTNTQNPVSKKYTYPMGIAVADYNNDGEADFFFSNVGTTPPRFMVKGDLRKDQAFYSKWILLTGSKGFQFVENAHKAKLANYEFSWGATFEDFNLDGLADLVVSENYVGFPPHKISLFRLPGRFLIQNTKGEFAAVGKQAGVRNSRYSIAPITGDFNLDGYPDLIHVNLAGKSKAFISKGGKANFIKVKLPNQVQSIGAWVHATLADGKVIREPYVVGEGLCSDSSHIITIGAGASSVSKVVVQFISGKKAIFQKPKNKGLLMVSYPTPTKPAPAVAPTPIKKPVK